jgi:hypothetical protein
MKNELRHIYTKVETERLSVRFKSSRKRGKSRYENNRCWGRVCGEIRGPLAAWRVTQYSRCNMCAGTKSFLVQVLKSLAKEREILG